MSLSLSGDPFPALERVKRVLKPIRVFQLYDWTWVLEKARFDLIADAVPFNKHHRLFAATPKPQA